MRVASTRAELYVPLPRLWYDWGVLGQPRFGGEEVCAGSQKKCSRLKQPFHTTAVQRRSDCVHIKSARRFCEVCRYNIRNTENRQLCVPHGRRRACCVRATGCGGDGVQIAAEVDHGFVSRATPAITPRRQQCSNERSKFREEGDRPFHGETDISSTDSRALRTSPALDLRCFSRLSRTLGSPSPRRRCRLAAHSEACALVEHLLCW